MPGISYYQRTSGATITPNKQPFKLANSMTGTGTPPAAQLQAGDFVVLTTNSSLTASGVTVCRMLLAADKTAHYKEGTPVAGILGVCTATVDTNSSGAATGAGVSPGGVIYGNPSEEFTYGVDSTGRGTLNVIIADNSTIFRGKLNSGTASGSIVNTLGGITLSTTSGVTTYTLNTTDTGVDACVQFTGYNPDDTTEVYFRIVSSFQQNTTGVDYSTQ